MIKRGYSTRFYLTALSAHCFITRIKLNVDYPEKQLYEKRGFLQMLGIKKIRGRTLGDKNLLSHSINTRVKQAIRSSRTYLRRHRARYRRQDPSGQLARECARSQLELQFTEEIFSTQNPAHEPTPNLMHLFSK